MAIDMTEELYAPYNPLDPRDLHWDVRLTDGTMSGYVLDGKVVSWMIGLDGKSMYSDLGDVCGCAFRLYDSSR
jgi:hypothetical protein